jgi:hypothetical protein
MAFTFEDPVTANQTNTGTVSISVSPSTSVIVDTNMAPGASVTGSVSVTNDGSLDAYYTLTADWSPTGSSTIWAATRLANLLSVDVSASTGGLIYSGVLGGLVDQPATPPLLASGASDIVSVTVTLPSTAGTVYQGIDLGFDLDFVAASPSV